MKHHTRRRFVQSGAALALAARFPIRLRAAVPAETDARGAAEKLHAELWRRFVDGHGLVLDETDFDGKYHRPTAEECRAGKPNAVGWLTPIANGGMFTGLYLDAMVSRARHTRAAEDAAKVHRLVGGLLLLSGIGGVPGFIARGPATDGKTTYALGSNDQTMPWFLGLWRYVRSGLAGDAEKARIVARMVEVADVLAGNGWKMPALPPFGERGSFAEPGWDGAPRLLLLQKMMHALTGDAKWARLYEQSLHEKDSARAARKGRADVSRVEACALGVASRPKPQMWTGAVSNACLRELWELERDETLRASYARGLRASAEFAAKEKLPLAREFNADSGKPYDGDWRKLLHLWRPQQTSVEATEVSEPQRDLKNKLSPRAGEEARFVREAAFAAWIITQCPEREIVARHSAEILQTITNLSPERLRLSTFFALECAWWRLQPGG